MRFVVPLFVTGKIGSNPTEEYINYLNYIHSRSKIILYILCGYIYIYGTLTNNMNWKNMHKN